MPLNRYGEILRAHAFAVVGHANECGAALFDRDGNFRRTGVQGIFYELLNYRGRTLYHLASGNAAGHFIRKNMNFHAGRTLL